MNQIAVLVFGSVLFAAVLVASRISTSRPLSRNNYLLDGLSIAILLIAIVGFFWRVLFQEEVWVPAGGGDLVSFLYPNYQFAAEWLKKGIIPLWNPYLYGGYPFAADIQSGLFYPINLFVFLAAPEITYRTMELLAIFHFFLAGVFMYFLMRSLSPNRTHKVSRLASLVSAMAYMFSDLFIVHLGNLNMIAVAAWLPLIFLLFHRAVSEGRLGLSAWAGLFLGIALLAGHIQPFLYIITALAVYLLCQLIAEAMKGSKAAVLMRLPLYFFITVVVASGISALQLIPAYELSKLSVRSDITYEASTAYSLAPAQLVSLIVPGFFGRGADSYWGPWLRTEAGYVGVLTLCLSVLAVSAYRTRFVYSVLIMAVFGLVMALGGYGVLHGWFYQVVPGFDKVRAPARFIFIFDFALSILAGLGLELLLRPLLTGHRSVLRKVARFNTFVLLGIGFGALPAFFVLLIVNKDSPGPGLVRTMGVIDGIGLAMLFLAGSIALLWARYYKWTRKLWLGVLAVALLGLDLASTGANVEIGKKDPTQNYQHPGVIEFLKADTGYYRIDSVTDVWDVWQPDTSVLNGIFDVMGVYNPLMLSSFENYWAKLGSRSSTLYDLLNAKYVIGHKGVPLDWDKFELAYAGDEQVNVYRNKKVLPRAFLVHNAVSENDENTVFDVIHKKDFDPSKESVSVQGKQMAGGDPAGSTVTISEYSPNQISLATQSEREGYLVLSEVYYPGWQASVDGITTEVFPADYLFRAVYLPPGEHVVKMSFEPTSWKVGLAISATTAIVLCSWGMVSVLVQRRRKSGI